MLVKSILLIFSGIGIFLAVNQIFGLQVFGLFLPNTYLYLILALYLSLVFLIYPLKKVGLDRRFFQVDFILFLLSASICTYFAVQGREILWKGWGFIAPAHMTAMAVVLWVLVLEAVRRTSGLSLTITLIAFSLYPLFAPYMPGLLEGPGRSFTTTAVFHSLSRDSILSIPLAVVGEMVIGFILFGVVLQATGGGRFFLNLAFALFGTTRGGAAKVSVFASALFGTISGSAVANVLTCGTVTIPAMKKAGYEASYAGAIEACASAGGPLMPPVMGAVAFVMASFLNISYAQVAAAAALPAVLYYFGLFVQVDGHAAKKNIVGVSRSEIPALTKTLQEGWMYLLALGVLLYFLFILRIVGPAPFYASAILLAAVMLRKETRLTLGSFLELIESTGRLLANLVAILAGVGIMLGALAVTGVASSLTREIIALAGGNLTLLLLLGALASFVLGTGMSVTATYIFLAIILAPALTTGGFNQMAVHLFVLYWGVMGDITPPVALSAFTAAPIAGAPPMKVAFLATRLGANKYILPFFFILRPAMVLEAGPGEIVAVLVLCALGVFLLSSGLEGYLMGIGRLDFPGPRGHLSRISLVISGILLGVPGWVANGLGLAIALIILLPLWLVKARNRSLVRT